MRLERAGIEGGVGLDEAQHRCEQRRDHARTLALCAEQDRALRERHLQAGALGPPIAGQDRLREGSSSIRAELPDGLLDATDDPVALQLDADHAGGCHADPGVFHVEGGGHAAGHRLGDLDPARAGPDVRVAGVHRHAAEPVELRVARHLDGRAHDRVAREQRGRDRVVVIADEHAHVPPPGGLRTRSDGAGPEAGRQARRLELGHALGTRDPARAEEGLDAGRHRRPAPSSRPSITFRFWTAWPAAPFQRLSIAQKTSTRPPGSTSA